jgi:hypothetical protein
VALFAASLHCGGKYDVCTRADEYVAKCTGRSARSTDCDTDPVRHCIASCIVTLSPPCSAFKNVSLDPNSPPPGGPEFAKCQEDCFRAYPSHD